MTLDTHSPVFAHRYLAHGSIEVICMNCLDVICNAQTEEAAAPFLKIHTCESAELERWTQITHPCVALNKWSPRNWWGAIDSSPQIGHTLGAFIRRVGWR